MDAPAGNAPRRENVALSVVRALLGAVTPEMRRVGFLLDGRKIQLFCIYDGAPSESLSEEMNDVEAEILADFAADVLTEVQLVRMDAPEAIKLEAIWVYARKEASSS